jgi:26S proteasome non-ATPase regulatory subunit 9
MHRSETCWSASLASRWREQAPSKPPCSALQPLCRHGSLPHVPLVHAATRRRCMTAVVVLQAGEGSWLEAAVMRQGAPVHLRLKPQKWAGPGLLGCHLRPVG